MNRRDFVLTGSGLFLGMSGRLRAEPKPETALVVGQEQAATVGNAVLADGGNAVDAVVAAAFAAAVVAVPATGLAGYGGHLVVAGLPRGKVAAIDFNGTAPAALKSGFFRADEKGEVKGDVNTYGWFACGVPGVPAGLELALERYGTRKFRDLLPPAIRLAREGFAVSKGFAASVKGNRERLGRDPGSAKLLLPNGEPLGEGAKFVNRDLATVLETLAEANSAEPFYRGRVAEKIVAAFKAGGGLLTAEDLAGYRAREVEPVAVEWNGHRVFTPPPTSGGLTVLQTLATLAALGWDGKSKSSAHELVEVLRIAWTDRLKSLGDPDQVEVPVQRLLSKEYSRESAARVREAVKAKRPVEGQGDGRPSGGTVHLNAVDARGLVAALTFTHGGSFGAQVTIDGLGLILGHGVSRFDPREGRANSPAPGKRPLHNMCPTVVTRGEVPVLAIGATGGRRIVNAVANVLARRLGEGRELADAVKAPRVHTEGDPVLTVEDGFDTTGLKEIGYTLNKGAVGALNAIERDPRGGEVKSAAR